MMNCMGASSMLLLLIVLILLHSSHCKTCNSNSDNSIISSSKNNNRKDKQVISTSSLALYKNSIRHSSLISIVGSNSVRKGASSIVCKSKGNAANDIQLFKVNILMFFFYATLGSCLPYLPLYFRYLGLNDHDVGLLGSITPAITFIVSPLWGGLADKTRRPKLIMLITFITTIITRTCLIFDYTNNIKMISIVLVVILTAVLNAPVKPLMDNTVMDLLKEKSDYGRSRLYGQIGFGVGSSLILLSIPTTILMFLQPDDPGTGVTVVTQTNSSDNKGSKSISRSEQRKMKNDLKLKKAFMSTLIQPKVVLFFLITFIIGVSSGVVENFAYVRINEVGNEHTDMGKCLGICRLLSSAAGAPTFYFAGQITKKIGINNVLLMSLLSYMLRFANYAYIRNPWQAIPAEILRGLTFGTFWSAATFYIYSVSPPGLTATMLSVLNGCYGGLGQSVGSLIGGALSKRMGLSEAFKYCWKVEGLILLLTYFLL